MTLKTKDVLKPDVYRKGNYLFEVTPEDIWQMADSVPALLDAGYMIPAWLEHHAPNNKLSYPVHSSNRQAVRRYEKDPWFAGWVKGGRVGDDGTLFLDGDFKPEIADSLSEVGAFVSPQYGVFDEARMIKDRIIYGSATNADGNSPRPVLDLPMAVHHLAIVRKPVNPNQTSEFTPISSSVSSQRAAGSAPSGGTSGKNSGTGLDELAFQSDKQPQQLSLMEAIQSGPVSFSLQDSVMNTGFQAPQQQTPGANPAMGMQDPQAMQDQANTQRFLQALQDLGVSIDPSCPLAADPECLSRVLGTLSSYSAEAMEKQKKQGAAGTPGSLGNLQEQATVVAMSQTAPIQTPVAGQPVQMSQGTLSQTPGTGQPQGAPGQGLSIFQPQFEDMNNRVTQMSQALVVQEGVVNTLKAQNAGLMNLVTAQSRKDYSNRIKVLRETGRCSVDQATHLDQLANAFQFSADSPAGQSELDITLKVLEALPNGAIMVAQLPSGMNPMQMSAGNIGSTPVGQTSQFFQGAQDVTPDRVNAILKEYGFDDQTGAGMLGATG